MGLYKPRWYGCSPEPDVPPHCLSALCSLPMLTGPRMRHRWCCAELAATTHFLYRAILPPHTSCIGLYCHHTLPLAGYIATTRLMKYCPATGRWRLWMNSTGCRDRVRYCRRNSEELIDNCFNLTRNSSPLLQQDFSLELNRRDHHRTLLFALYPCSQVQAMRWAHLLDGAVSS